MKLSGWAIQIFDIDGAAHLPECCRCHFYLNWWHCDAIAALDTAFTHNEGHLSMASCWFCESNQADAGWTCLQHCLLVARSPYVKQQGQQSWNILVLHWQCAPPWVFSLYEWAWNLTNCVCWWFSCLDNMTQSIFCTLRMLLEGVHYMLSSIFKDMSLATKFQAHFCAMNTSVCIIPMWYLPASLHCRCVCLAAACCDACRLLKQQQRCWASMASSTWRHI